MLRHLIICRIIIKKQKAHTLLWCIPVMVTAPCVQNADNPNENLTVEQPSISSEDDDLEIQFTCHVWIHFSLNTENIMSVLHKLSSNGWSVPNIAFILVGLVWRSAATWRYSTFIRWTGWTLKMTWQQRKHCQEYYYYYYYYQHALGPKLSLYG